MLEDAELLRRYVREKSETAFAELVARHLDLVYSAALRQVGGDTHRAQDVSQIVFTTLARKADALASHPVLTGWLYTTTQHAAAKAIRAEVRRRVREHEAYLMQKNFSSDAAVDWERVRPVLDAAMRELGERDREAVLLRFFSRRAFGEIGRALALNEDAARMRVERALDKLHGLLAKRGVTSTATALGVALASHAATAAPAGMGAVLSRVALTQSAASGATAGVVSFMTTTKFIGLTAAVLAVLAIGTATREVLANRAAAVSLTTAEHERDVLAARAKELESSARIAEQERAVLARQLADARTEATRDPASAKFPAAGSAGQANVTPDRQLATGQAFLERHPDVKQALVERSRARVDSRFQSLYRQLNLTPDQIERFRTLMIEGEGLNTSDSNTGPMILRPGTGMTQKEVDAAIHELLGEDGYKQFQDTSRLVGPRGTVLQIAGSLYFTDTPLTAVQAEQLVRAMDATRTEMKAARQTGDAYWPKLLERAGTFLAPPQVEILAGMRQQEDFERALNAERARWNLPGWGKDAKPSTPAK